MIVGTFASTAAFAATSTDVSDSGQLAAALKDSNIETINIKADITGIAEALVVNHAVTINGGDKTLSFTAALNTLLNGERQGILVNATGTKIDNLSVVMAGVTGWQGVYGIQVYNATEVILDKVTASGADAALLVNGSKVELTGVTTVTGNEFGGIEVSKGTGLTTNSALTVTEALVNDTEAYEQPTIWLVNGQGTVTGANVPGTTNKTLKFDQTQYYTVAAHSGASTLDAVEEALDQVKDLTPSDTLDDEDKADIKAAIEAVLGLNDATKQTLNNDDIKKLDELLAAVSTNVETTVGTPTIDPAVVENDKITVKPTVSGLLLATGITGNETVTTKVTLTTNQLTTTGSNILAFELSLKKFMT